MIDCQRLHLCEASFELKLWLLATEDVNQLPPTCETDTYGKPPLTHGMVWPLVLDLIYPSYFTSPALPNLLLWELPDRRLAPRSENIIFNLLKLIEKIFDKIY